MANSFDNAFIRGYNNSVYQNVEIQGNAFRGKMDERAQTGELEFYETLGSVYANTVADGSPGNATVISDAAHEKRVCAQTDYDVAMLISKFDQVKALVNFDSFYVQRMSQALNRKRDIATIKGALGTATTGKLADGTAAFDFANQTIAVGTGSAGATGMNVAKLRAIKAAFWKAGFTNQDQMCVALTGTQIADLLSETEVGSADYNTVRALVNGEVNQFMGIEIVQSEQLPFALDAGGVNLNWDATDKPIDVDTNSTRACFAWVKPSVVVGVNPEIVTKVSERDDLKYDWQAYASIGVGAVRLDESGCLYVPCLEA